MKKPLIIVIIILVILGGWFAFGRNGSQGDQKATQSTAKKKPFDKSQNSIDDASSVWVVVNKQRPLQPKSYTPDDLIAPNVPLRLTAKDQEMLMRKDAALAFEKLVDAARRENVKLMLASAYRSHNFQENLYNRYVSQQGQVAADTQSARPGHSEHQTGLAVDVEPETGECEIEVCFAQLKEGKWIAKNAYKFGFVLRYLEDKDDITGYMYEPWHLRYVGKELAAEIHAKDGITLEEFFGLEPAPDYN